MSESTIKVEYDGRICILTLNAPDTLNAMTDPMGEEFKEAIEKIKNNPKPKVLVITGAGRAFSAGGNLDKIIKNVGVNPARSKKESFDFYRLFLSVTDLQIPTIAAINGHAVGAGGCLAVACDMRFAAKGAKIGFTFIKLGLNPGMGAEYLLTRTIGSSKTFELLMTGDIIPVEEVLSFGLVNNIYEKDELMDKVMALARKIANMPAMPIRAIKETVQIANSASLDDILHKQAAYQALCYQGNDVVEGITAIREKRDPVFSDEE